MDRTAEIQGKLYWCVSPLLDKDSQPIKKGRYFPAYSVITYKDKKAVILVDCRDAIVKVVSGWHDEIIGMNWSGDYRWNSDKPCVVVEDGKYNLLVPHSDKQLLEAGVKFISPNWIHHTEVGYFVKGVSLEGETIIITDKGFVIFDPDCIETQRNRMEEVKKWDNTKIQADWIDKGMPCGYIRGLEYKGATLCLITPEKAAELFKTHHRFDGMFNSAEWRFYDGKVILLFRDYANSDYD